MKKANEAMQVEGTNVALENRRHAEKRSERGASMVEYALLVGLITVVAIAAVRFMGEKVSTQINTAASQI